MTIRRYVLFALFCLVTSIRGEAQERPTYTRVLLPLVASLRGVNGSEFSSSVTAYNDSEADFEFFPYNDRCQIGICFSFIQAHQTLTPSDFNLTVAEDIVPGYFISYDDRFAGAVQFSIHVTERSRQTQNRGVEIPAVPEADFRPRVILPSLPGGAQFRRMLRVYEASGLPRSRFRLRIYDVYAAPGKEHVPIVDMELETITPESSNFDVPGYAQVDLSSLHARLRDAFPVRITVESLEDARLWAMASVTHNETQTITVVTPQR
jgi:hypothetical protein